MIQYWQRLLSNPLTLFLLILSLLGSPSFAQSFDEAVNAYDEGRYDDAYTLFYQLASLGHADALNNLGALYQTGKGTTINYLYAIKAYERAGAAGHIDGAYNASNLTRLGIGTKKNMATAYAWAILAARNGASDMIAYRDILKEALTPEELNRGIEQAKALLEPLERSELAMAWLLPIEITDPLPEHIDRLNRRKQHESIIKKEEPDFKENPLLANIPLNFKAIAPQRNANINGSSFDNRSVGTQESNYTANTKSLSKPSTDTSAAVIPPGFTALKPGDKSLSNDQSADNNLNNPFDNDGNSATKMANRAPIQQNDSNYLVPEGFTEITPNQSDFSNPSQYSADSNNIPPPSPAEQSIQQSPLSNIFNEGYTLLKPLDSNQPNHKKEGMNESEKPFKLTEQRTFPTALNHSGETIYRPQKEAVEYEGATVLKPRRLIAPTELTLEVEKRMSDELNIIVTNIARANNRSFDATFEALCRKNPQLISKNDEEIFIINDTQGILKTPSKEETDSL